MSSLADLDVEDRVMPVVAEERLVGHQHPGAQEGRRRGRVERDRRAVLAGVRRTDPGQLLPGRRQVDQLGAQASDLCPLWVVDAKRCKGRPELRIEGGILRPQGCNGRCLVARAETDPRGGLAPRGFLVDLWSSALFAAVV